MAVSGISRLISVLLAVFLLFGVFMQSGCAGDPSETTPNETTPTATPAESTPIESTPIESTGAVIPETTPEATPVETTPESTPVETAPESTPVETAPESTPAETTSESTPVETTPDSTPIETTPESTPTETTSESTPIDTTPETTPDLDAVYSITYELDGGIGADENPDTYTYLDEDITLFVPVKKGYAFAGWMGTGIDAATEKVVIPSGSYGDRVYTATWKEVENVYGEVNKIENPYSDEDIAAMKDSHKELAANPNILTDPSVPDTYETRGNGIFFAKTAYTDITVDGIMDNVYTYGLHFELDLPQYKGSYVDVDTNFDAYLIMGQDGKMHVFVNVTDHDIVMEKALWDLKFHHCDVFQMYIDYDADKLRFDDRWDFAGEPDKKFVKQSPKGDWIVVMTENGFAVEYEFDNNGEPFEFGDEFGFSFFYNDSWDYVSTNKYGRSNTRNSSALVPASGDYQAPDAITQDKIFITNYPVTYTENIIPDKEDSNKTGEIFKDLSSGASSAVIVYAENSSAHTEINAEVLTSALAELGISIAILREDRVTDLSRYDYVIYINGAKDADSIAAVNEFHYAEYGVKLLDNKMISVGWQAKANTAITEIIEAIFGYAVSGGDPELIGTYTEALDGIPGENVPKVEGAQWITDSGDDAYVVHKLDTVEGDYNAYKALLEAAGYKLHVENVISTVKNATYYTEDTVINVLYSTADKDLRVSVEPMYNTALPALAPEEYTASKQSSVTLLNPNNLTMIIRLDNGEFIVIDSGNRNTHNYIYEELLKQHKSNRPLVIAAWIFTHFHQDHMGGFIDFTMNKAYMDRVTIKSVIFNFPEKQVLDTASAGDQVNLGLWPECLQICRDQGATIYQARTGQKYYFGNAVIEILHTYDDLMPFFVRSDNTNHTNILFSVAIEGQKIMVTGDLTNPGFLVAATRYGNYLKSDILQVAHHGHGDGSNDTTFYGLVNAPVVLVPGTGVKSAQKWAADNAKEVYFRSDGTKTLMLPYVAK